MDLELELQELPPEAYQELDKILLEDNRDWEEIEEKSDWLENPA